MKHYAAYLLLMALCYACTGTSSKPLLKKSPYDASFRYYAERLEGKNKKVKHIKKMETAYQLAQKSDLIAADSMLNLEQPDRWLFINAYHRRIQGRQQKVLALLPIESKDGYKPDLLTINNIGARESASRKASAQYLYQQSEDLLATDKAVDAREAYRTLVNLKENYYPVWESSTALLDSASRVGVEHVLVEGYGRFSPSYIDSKWQKFYRDASARENFDIIIRSHGLQVYVGPDSENRSCYTESKQIEVGYTEKKDSAGNVIERTAIYETISATVTEVEVTKTADASLFVDVIDGLTGALIRNEAIASQHYFSEKSVVISGDRRALSACPVETSFMIFTPSYWDMENKVLAKLDCDFTWFVRSRLWTE
jgi:hypothetical protein